MFGVDMSNKLSGQRILVTGASGFIGTRLCRLLSNENVEIHALSRIKRFDKENNLRWWQGDITDITTVRELLHVIKPDIIVHLAAVNYSARDLELVFPTFNVNVVTTINLLMAVTEVGCHRVILIGSLEEPERDAIPSSPYAASKWVCSAYGKMFHLLYQLPIVILRVFMVYGPAQLDSRKLIPSVILSLLQGKAPKISSGERQVDWIYIDDVVYGILEAAHMPNVEGNTIDLGSGILISIRSVVNKIVEIINPRDEPLFGALQDRPFEQIRAADTAIAYAKLGWKPLTSLEKGLEYTVEWFREQLPIYLKNSNLLQK
jgi:nucleoside-diphosphate-sugar epimerase